MLLFTVVGEAQVSLLVNCTSTLLLVRGFVVNVGALVPELLPFTSHWNVGLAPPLVDTAVSVK